MIGKDLDQVTKEDLQKFVATINNSSLKEWTKHDYKVAVKKFYRLMEGRDDDPDFIPEKVRWLKTTMKEDEFVDPNLILRAEEVEKIVASCPKILHKAICRFLFETGVRAGDLLEMKIRDINLKESYVTINGTKTKYSRRIVPIMKSVPFLAQWLENHPDCDPDSPVWMARKGERLSYNTLCYILSEGARRAGITNRKVNPHAWRKASATENSKFLTFPQLCSYHGWKIGSEIPMHYIRYTQDDIKRAIRKKNGLPEEQHEKPKEIKICQRCEKECDPVASFCDRCGFMFSDSDRVVKIKELAERREKADHIMNVATKYPELLKVLEDIMKKESI